MYYHYHIFCCTNKRPDGHERGCCIDRGSGPIRQYMKDRCKELGISDVRVNAAGCLDRCEEGPIMVIYPEGIWYRCLNEQDVDEVIEKHLQSGEIVERLVVKNNP